MARMHILQQGGMNLFNVIVHAPTPGGSNAAGIPWSVALQNSGLAKTIMSIGNGAGQISQNEANSVQGGTVIEATFQWGDDPNWTTQQRLDDLNVRAAQAVQAVIDDYSQRLKYYGYTVA